MQKLVFTNGGGQTIDLTSGNFGITNWEGLSGVGLNIQTQQVPFQDGGVFLDALMEQREISVTVAIQDNNDLSARYELKRQLISALNPKLGEGVLVYTNDYLSRQIKAVPQLPIFENKNSNDAGTLKASVVFSCPSPYWEDLEDTVVSLANGVRTNVSNGGDVPCGVKVEMTTGNTVNPFIRNFRQNKKVGIKGSYLTNVQINTELGKKSVTTQDMTFEQSMGQYSVKAFAYSLEEGLIVGVGTNNGICVSGNGEDWRVVDTPIGYNQDLNGICYSPILNKFIAVGGATNIGIIYSSTDGVNWKVETDQIANQLNDVFYSEELDLFIAVGNAGIIIKSTDGTTWTDLTSGVSVNLNKICYAKNLGLFVVVGASGTILTSEDLTTWTAQTSGHTSNLRSIAYSETLNLFLVGASSQTYYLTSSDAITWTEQTGAGIIDIFIYIKELSMFVGGHSSLIRTSTDGINWTSTGTLSSSSINTFYYVKQIGYILCSGQDGQIYASTDGTGWVNKVNRYLGMLIRNMIYQGGYFYAVGYYDGDQIGKIARTTDGNSWEILYTNDTHRLQDIIYISDLQKFFAVGSGGLIVKSTDGITWEETYEHGDSYNWFGATYSHSLGMIMLVGTSTGTLRSTDGGETWTLKLALQSQRNRFLQNVTFSEKLGLFVAVGGTYGASQINMCYRSSDGINWTGFITGHSGAYQNVCYSEYAECFIATGYSSTLSKPCYIARSADGINWVEKTLPDFYGGYGVIYSNYYHLFIVTGYNGECIISPDGIEWKKLPTGVKNYLYCAVEKDGVIYVAGGQGGLFFFMQSQEINTENIIANLTTDSDMTMGLDVGSNEVLLGCASGDVSATISFRQKYIGV